MTNRAKLLSTSNLTSPPAVEPAFNLRNPMAWPRTTTVPDWSTLTPEQILARMDVLLRFGTPGDAARGLIA